jgi:isoleucyl-tRNA synthetase
MKASLPIKEPKILEKWETNKVFEKLRKKIEGKREIYIT